MNPLLRLALLLIAAYRLLLSPLLGARCRFSPGCSAYASAALRAHGLWRGGLLTFKRLARCHPYAAPGFDPVPERKPAP